MSLNTIYTGQMPYEPKRSNARHLAFPDGTFVLEVWRQDASADEPYIKVAISEVGRGVIMREEKGKHIFKTIEGDTAIFNLVMSGPNTSLAVGTYEIHTLVNYQYAEIQHVTVVDSPFVSGQNSDYVDSISQRSRGGWVLKGELPITGGETGKEIRYYKPFLRTPNWFSAGLYDADGNSVPTTVARVTERNAERFQVEFTPQIPAAVSWTLVWAAWI